MLEYLRACAGNNEATKPVYCHHLPVIRSQYSTKYQPIMRPDSVIVSCACFFCILIVSLFCNHHHHHHHHNEEDQNRGKMKWDRMIVERQISSFPIEMEREMYCSVSFLSEWMVVGGHWYGNEGRAKLTDQSNCPFHDALIDGSQNQFVSWNVWQKRWTQGREKIDSIVVSVYLLSFWLSLTNIMMLQE